MMSSILKKRLSDTGVSQRRLLFVHFSEETHSITIPNRSQRSIQELADPLYAFCRPCKEEERHMPCERCGEDVCIVCATMVFDKRNAHELYFMHDKCYQKYLEAEREAEEETNDRLSQCYTQNLP